MPAAAPDDSAATRLRSTSVTRAPSAARRCAMPQPMTPPPTTTKSGLASVTSQKLEERPVEFLGLLGRNEVVAILDDDQARARNELRGVLAHLERVGRVLPSPDDEGGCFDERQ